MQDEYKDRFHDCAAQRTLIQVLADSWTLTAKWRKRKRKSTSSSSSRTGFDCLVEELKHKYFCRDRSVVVVIL